jgi:saccharopine dehydrogenase-like NADP-dependent oxidoreductase
MKNVLILGAGLVVKPMVEYLLENGYQLKIATTTREKADKMIKNHPNGSSMTWSADDTSTLARLVTEHDITVSFLPYQYHPGVARVCIQQKKPMITTSYVSAEMQALDRQAKESGVLLLNESGLDPGIDHMTAMRIIDHVHNKGGKIEEFYSMCGALPAPEAADNPLRYKFSWSPRGVVRAGMNNAVYLKKGKTVVVRSEDLFKDTFKYDFPKIGELEVYPNRDSKSYIGVYGIQEAITMYRGTFRYRGWCESIDAMKDLHLFDETEKDYNNMTYNQFLAERAGLQVNELRRNLCSKMGWDEKSIQLRSLEFLGFFSDENLNYGITSPFNITANRMISKMSLHEQEHDAVILQHVFLASYSNGRKEVIKSSLFDSGSPATNTAVARTVALPASVAVRMILDKRIDLAGVYRPVIPAIYNPVLRELGELGIEIKEEFGLPESDMIG